MKCIRKRKIKEKKQETSRHTGHAPDIFGLTETDQPVMGWPPVSKAVTSDHGTTAIF